MGNAPESSTGLSLDFVESLIQSGGPVAKANDLPAAAMVACGIAESARGTSPIYRTTRCPFNLQKPPHYTWVHAGTITLRTGTKTDKKSGRILQEMYAPFCVALGRTQEQWLADATRIWCEWVLGWPILGARKQVLASRHNPEAFARALPLVGFGEGDKRAQNGNTLVQVMRDHNLLARCSNLTPGEDQKVSLPVPAWLLGWWQVSWRGQTFYYYFNKDLLVTWSQVPPLVTTQAPLIIGDTGKYIVEAGPSIAIHWRTSGSREVFRPQAGAAPKTLTGRWQELESLQATKL
jgi:hypothetical protein